MERKGIVNGARKETVIRMDDEHYAFCDWLVARGIVRSRSEAMRKALSMWAKRYPEFAEAVAMERGEE